MNNAHIRALDGVRGLALLIVMFAHTRPQVFPGGNIGVDLFFSLSGFLITSILLSEHEKTGGISIRNFYIRRALRLFPALAVVVLSVIAYAYFFTPEKFALTLDNARAVALYYWNWVLAANIQHPDWQKQDMFSHLWSLSVEEQFYIVWPLILIVTLPSSAPRWAFGAVLLLGIAGPAIARALLWKGGVALDLYFRTDLRFDNLFWGAAAAWLVTQYRGKLQSAQAPIAVVGVIGLVSIICLSRFEMLSNGFLYMGGYTAVGILASCLIVAAAIGTWVPLKALLQFKPLAWTGEISYGLYLWHVPSFT